MEKLALLGGPKTKNTPFGTGKRFGLEEKKQIMEVLDNDVLFYFLGKKVFEFQEAFAKLYNMKYCIACSSGTAAVHIALGTLELTPGSEVITSAITDMGTLTGILYQNLVPVFADIDPLTYNMTHESVEKCISKRTGAIIVVHHSGLAADMDGFVELSQKYNIPLVEDCAQAYLCEYKGKLVGTMGVISAFSLNHFKHITCGSGGMVVTNDNRKRKIATLFVDKCFDREAGERNPFFLAPNYQMTELQGAVALAQLKKLPWIIDQRRTLGDKLTEYLQNVPSITPQFIPQGAKHSYFLFLFRVNLSELKITLVQFSDALNAEGIPNKPHVITGGMCEYQYKIFKNQSCFPNSKYPFVNKEFGTNASYKDGLCPVAEEAFEETVTLEINEFYTETDIKDIAAAINKVVNYFISKKA